MRYGPSVSVKCCHPKPAVPVKYSCFWPKIFDEFENILKRQYCMQTRRQTIHEFALPKWQKSKYIKPCYCMKKSIELVYPDAREPTRTLQLGYPTIRQFLALKESRFYKTFPQIRKDAINRHMRKSHYSLYTYLSTNRMICMKKPEKPYISKKRRKRMMARMEELAEPKEIPPEPEVDRGEEGEMSAKRLKKLATPKQYPPGHEKEPWRLTEAAKRYKPSEAILRMSKPKPEPPSLINPDWDKINPNALKYKATKKIKEMAQPHLRPVKDASLKEGDPFAINPKALKAKCTKRIKEMAEPKDFDDIHNREDPFAISPKALKAKATPRLIELAKPKTYGL